MGCGQSRLQVGGHARDVFIPLGVRKDVTPYSMDVISV